MPTPTPTARRHGGVSLLSISRPRARIWRKGRSKFTKEFISRDLVLFRCNCTSITMGVENLQVRWGQDKADESRLESNIDGSVNGTSGPSPGLAGAHPTALESITPAVISLPGGANIQFCTYAELAPNPPENPPSPRRFSTTT